jgi:hypothetical protein
MCGFCKVWVCVCMGFVKCGCVYVLFFNLLVFLFLGFLNFCFLFVFVLCGCVCVVFVICGCVYVWVL